MASITKKVGGQKGNRKNFLLKGMELNDRKTNGVCNAAIISTTWPRKTNPGALVSVQPRKDR